MEEGLYKKSLKVGACASPCTLTWPEGWSRCLTVEDVALRVVLSRHLVVSPGVAQLLDAVACPEFGRCALLAEML